MLLGNQMLITGEAFATGSDDLPWRTPVDWRPGQSVPWLLQKSVAR
jgi:hypothetical protein